jgi:NADPH:quinone reductase-like Zn-dependent oxidoreductase
MKKYSVLVTTTFDGYVEIEASTAEEAIEEVWKMISLGEVTPVADFEPFTEVPFAEEIK